MKYTRISNVDTAEVIKVIKIESIAGEGTHKDPVHTVTEYFSLDGKRLARTTYKSKTEKIVESK